MNNLKEWMNPLLSAEDRVRIADGEIARLRAELVGAIKARNAAMMLYNSARQFRDDLLMQQHEWRGALVTLEGEREANALLTAEVERLHLQLAEQEWKTK